MRVLHAALYYLVRENSQTPNKRELLSAIETDLSEGNRDRLLLLLHVVLEHDAPEL